ncbi:class I SAM-dependent methyltransferase [Bradyrhizobium sp. WBOS7]|uniref:Class I SAM-dependent methyltransferase n=1 Tax=Bradyrhizobium betae TaxID=244734 RepID=A0AAE9NF73_9BRAD|nr:MULTISPECIES: class I SAM-dependent methyltransferase [Bradyrhizobium]MDD1569351.1 class I SAM-dependent methyltransferase [Bradyrhizobium sp. WBOS1]UUO38144.1 class I SAM-dependent methyltransferase [Bradyrhizobium sp. WBOS01]MDD1529824.1 class I SAM-dependent methyltransferase [Bradyrhizobium sp. WBOS2]MDD1576470.1 class I SAM-dependent methyltransferase [Bradyrhizobium sp. WBOS7]MDD1602311.1 class I SAM-dependent methyltransferase [Bradyrhizobium sp. WBOS16]
MNPYPFETESAGSFVTDLKNLPGSMQSQQSSSDSFGFQWAKFKTTQLDSHTGLSLTLTRFFSNTKWKPKDINGKSVLEAGSGAGRFTEVLLDAGAIVTTFDASIAIDVNRENNAGRGDVKFLRADIYDIPVPNGSFDFVFCYGVIQHLPDAEKALESLVSKLKPGGRISIDHYLKTSALDPFNQPKYFWRRWTVGMEPERLLRIISAYMPVWLPINTLIQLIPYFGPKIAALTMIPCWNYLRSGLNRQQRLEWAILDTFDALSPAYDTPRTLEEVRELVARCEGLTDINVFYGSNGVVANAVKR